MQDQSHLDKKYFINTDVYNCPFCNRNNVTYTVSRHFEFDWKSTKRCHGYLVECSSCGNTSMHLSFDAFHEYKSHEGYQFLQFTEGTDDIDAKIFYSVPTSFFVMDERIPSLVRELMTESEGCLKINFLTGASACMRKAIYELLVLEEAKGPDYETRIKSLKEKYPDSDPVLFDILSGIQDMTSDKIHEQSWDKWDSGHLKLIIETLKTILHDIYVLPQVKAERLQSIRKLRDSVKKDKRAKLAPRQIPPNQINKC